MSKNKKVIILSVVILCLIISVCFIIVKPLDKNISESSDIGNSKENIENNKKTINSSDEVDPLEKENNSDNSDIADNNENNTEEEKEPNNESEVELEDEKESETEVKPEDEKDPEKPLTIEEQNQKLIKLIKTDHNVTVDYGTRVSYYYGGSAIQTTSSDENEINTYLTKLDLALDNIPKSIIDKLVNYNGYSIEIFKYLPGDKEGYAVTQPFGEHKIVVELDTSERLIYHETWHIMEMYMYHKNNKAAVFNNWADMTPDSFVYGVGTNNNDFTGYDRVSPKESIGFVSSYAKTAEEEDRAELFADLIFRPTKQKYMYEGYLINEKAKIIDSYITRYFGNITNARYRKWITF